MGEYVKVNGHATWVDVWGHGAETVVLLHGGLSNSDVLMESIGRPIAEHHRVVTYDRRGHGRTGDTAAPFHYDDMVAEAIGVLERVVGHPAHLVGWSDGGIVALLVALRRPDLVGKIVLIGANYHYDGVHEVPEEPWPELFGEMAESYGERSPDGPAHFPVVLDKWFPMIASEPTLTVDELRAIEAPALVLSGDDDLVRLDHTCALYAALNNGQLAVVPGTSHALPIEQPAEVARLVLEFLAMDGPPPTMMPIRRSVPPG